MTDTSTIQLTQSATQSNNLVSALEPLRRLLESTHNDALVQQNTQPHSNFESTVLHAANSVNKRKHVSFSNNNDMDTTCTNDSDNDDTTDLTELDELMHASHKSKRRKLGNTVLTAQQQKLVGNGNSAFVEGKFELAIKYFNDLINEIPTSIVPYKNLVLIYSECGETLNKIKCELFIVEILRKNINENLDEILTLYDNILDSAEELHLYDIQLFVCTKLIRIYQTLYKKTNDNNDLLAEIDYRKQRATVHIQQQNYTRALTDLQRIYDEQHDASTDTLKQLLLCLHETNAVKKIQQYVTEYVDSILQSDDKAVDIAVIDYLFDIHLRAKQYDEILDIVDKIKPYCDMNTVDITVRVKYAAAVMVHEEYSEFKTEHNKQYAATVLNDYYQSCIDSDNTLKNECVSLFTEIAHIYYDLKQFDTALQYYNKLIELDPNNITLLQKLYFIHYDNENNDTAIQLCEQILQINNNESNAQTQTRIYKQVVPNLLDLYKRHHQYDRAKNLQHKFQHIIESDTTTSVNAATPYTTADVKPMDYKLLPQGYVLDKRYIYTEHSQIERTLHKCIPLYDNQQYQLIVDQCLDYIYCTLIAATTPLLDDTTDIKSSKKTLDARARQICRYHKYIDLCTLVIQSMYELNKNDTTQLFNLVQLIESWINPKVYMDAAAHANKKVEAQTSREQFRRTVVQIALQCHNIQKGDEIVRLLITSNAQSTINCKLMYEVLQHITDHITHQNLLRFCDRAMRRDSNFSAPLVQVVAHGYNTHNSHQYSLSLYKLLYDCMPQNTDVLLYMSVCLLELGMRRTQHNKQHALLSAFTYLYKYKQLCQNSAESLYNVGRAYHYIGAIDFTWHYYNQALLVYTKQLQRDNVENKALLRKIIQNLGVLYSNSGSPELTDRLCKQYGVEINTNTTDTKATNTVSGTVSIVT